MISIFSERPMRFAISGSLKRILVNDQTLRDLTGEGDTVVSRKDLHDE